MKYSRIILAVILLFIGCGEGEDAVKVDLTRRETVIIKEEPGVITYAYLPQYSHTVSYTRHQALISYLHKKTGLEIKQIFPDTFEQHMKMVGQGKIDISYSNPFIYIKIAHQNGAKAFARIVEEQGKDKFRGQIIARADNEKIHTIADCRNKRYIAVDSTSAGGYLYPLGLFAEHGITADDFRELAFAPGPGGKQEKVILSVYAGKYDIGSIREGALKVVAKKIDVSHIKVIAATAPYPGWVYAAKKGLDPAVTKKLKTALLSLDFNRNDHRIILEKAHFTKVIASVDSDFDPVRKLAGEIGMNYKTQKGGSAIENRISN